jgi:hypothetical protein
MNSALVAVPDRLALAATEVSLGFSVEILHFRFVARRADADAEKLALYVGEAASTAIIGRPVLVPVQRFSVPSLRTKPGRAYS